MGKTKNKKGKEVTKTNSFSLYVIIFIILLICLLAFLITKDSGLILGKHYEITPTPTSIPTIFDTPTPTPKPTYIDPNPIISCSINASCGGGYRQMRKSECDASTCCLIDVKCGGPQVMSKAACASSYCCILKDGAGKLLNSKAECDNYYSNPNPKTNSNTPVINTYNAPSYPSCTVYYPGLHYSQTYTNISPDLCKSWQDAANAGGTTNTQSAIPTPTPTVDNSAICNQIIQEWDIVKTQINDGNYSSSAEEAVAYISTRDSYRQKLSSYGCPGTVN